jgi:DNA-binding response OmpR family regulator
MRDDIIARILLLEDDPNLGFMVAEHLKLNGYEIKICTDGKEGLEAIKNIPYDLLLVDIMMPKMDGFTFAREVRNRNDDLPIIFLTARSLQEDKKEGFDIGCDDYITKPFSVDELLLRIRAVLKRTQKNKTDEKRYLFEIGQYRFDSRKRILTLKEEETRLTSKETELLRLLCLNSGKILERNSALETIWGNEDYFSGRSMDVFISKLRKYLKSDDRIEIVNVHGKGFKLVIDQ